MTDQDKTGGPPQPATLVEDLRMSGADLVGGLRELMKEGDARRVTVLNEHGDELISISLTRGAVAGGLGALSAPARAAVGATAARAGPALKPGDGVPPPLASPNP